ncbi:MAG TPA: CHAT domain-containing protein, partial [Bacteroidetes bacterium]|nr:CHAT domain-containing protein [Bacteroidota bacterium]
GNVYLKIAQTKKALSYYQKALICLIPDFNHTNYQINPDLNQVDLKKKLIEVFSQKSLALQKLYLEENKSKETADLCMATAELGIELIDRLRKEFGADTDKQFLLAQSYQLFEVAIEMAFESKQFEKAFQLSEQSKAIVLYQAIKNKQAERLASTDETSLERLYQIRYDLQTCSAKIRDERDTKKLNELRDRKFKLNRKYENLIDELEKNSDFKKIKEELPSLSIADIQTQVLKSNQAFVEYFVGKNDVYAFYFLPNATDLQCKKIPWTDSLQKAAKEINSNIYQKENTAYIKNARLLYKELLATIFTEGIPKRLLLIPDDVLGFVPFNALLTKDIPSKQLKNFKAYPYLAKNTIITQGFSATIQWEMQKKAKVSDGQVLAYAPGFLDPKTLQEAAVLRSQFMNLSHNTEEVGYVLKNFKGKAICDEKATKKHFIHHAHNAKIIHIASHAKVNRLHPDLSYIAFSNLEDTTTAAVIMYIEEIYNISLNAAMIVLSACETSIGDLIPGEGMISLARAFIYAGAKSIVTSLWKVTDRSSCQIMGYFYTNLKNKQDKDVALNKALIRYINKAPDQNRAHPKYWAAFIIIGNTDMLTISSFPLALIVITLLFFGVFIFLKRRKRKLRHV